MKRHKGTISIARIYGGETCIHISIVDESSGTEFFDGTMSIEAFGNAATGASSQPIEFEFRPDHVGMICEHKVELVSPPKDSDWNNREKAARKTLVPFEVDGWKGRVSDVLNHHCRAGDKQRVNFFRYVPAP